VETGSFGEHPACGRGNSLCAQLWSFRRVNSGFMYYMLHINNCMWYEEKCAVHKAYVSLIKPHRC
jgi:hypothetical protein